MNYFLKKNVRKKSLGQFFTFCLNKGVRVEIVCRLLYQFMRWQKINPTLTGRVSEDMRAVPLVPSLADSPVWAVDSSVNFAFLNKHPGKKQSWLYLI